MVKAGKNLILSSVNTVLTWALYMVEEGGGGRG